MNSLTHPSAATLPVPNLSSRSPLRRGFLLLPVALACFALSQGARAADGGLGNQNTAEGTGALSSVTSGTNNTAIGFDALKRNTGGLFNTASGSLVLTSNVSGNSNTATGFTTGFGNAAQGAGALFELHSESPLEPGYHQLVDQLRSKDRVVRAFGACSVAGCNCQGFMGSGQTCENCGHSYSMHW